MWKNMWQKYVTKKFEENMCRQYVKTICEDNMWRQYLKTVCEDNMWRQYMKTIFEEWTNEEFEILYSLQLYSKSSELIRNCNTIFSASINI